MKAYCLALTSLTFAPMDSPPLLIPSSLRHPLSAVASHEAASVVMVHGKE
jgi:hypothetical protein